MYCRTHLERSLSGIKNEFVFPVYVITEFTLHWDAYKFASFVKKNYYLLIARVGHNPGMRKICSDLNIPMLFT